jgi:hypothetical protein
MRLTLRRVMRIDRDVRSCIDRRHRVNVALAEYDGPDGPYRKEFESKSEPTVPQSGTHAELNGARKQW